MAKNYINNEQFHKIILDYHERKKKNPQEKIPEVAGFMIIEMATRLATKHIFRGYTFKEEMISDGILRAIEVFNNYNPAKFSNPFAYFTMIIWRSFLQRIQKEKLERFKRENLIMMNEIFTLQDSDKNNHLMNKDSFLQDFVFNSYE